MLLGKDIRLETIQMAYKKLKAAVLYDKKQLLLRNALVEYEQHTYKNCLEEHFQEIIENLQDEEQWQKYGDELLSHIEINIFPKQISENNEKGENTVVYNHDDSNVEINKLQSIIHLPVDGQLIGILWILSIGQALDNNFPDCVYGNRLWKKPTNNKQHVQNNNNSRVTFSPYLFSLYFKQYEQWRNQGLSIAENLLNDGQDAIILTLDLKRFYYSINFTPEQSEACYQEYLDALPRSESDENEIIHRLNQFVYKVLKKYSKLHIACEGDDMRTFLPIGFFPSNILANYYLSKFDHAVRTLWNPQYYGRYVDDILIVAKVEKDFMPFSKKQDKIVTPDDIIQYFCCGDPANRINAQSDPEDKNGGLLVPFTSENEPLSYRINPRWLNNKTDTSKDCSIMIQSKKVNVIYLKAEGTSAPLRHIKQLLLKNSSEFRYLPQDDEVFKNDDFSEIFESKNTDSINKINVIKDICINKYALSKFLGKLLRIAQYTTPSTKWEDTFYGNLLKIFDYRNIIDNYLTWGRVLQLLVMRNRFEEMKQYIGRIDRAIKCITYTEPQKESNLYKKLNVQELLQSTLHNYLNSAVYRELSLVWGPKATKFLHWYAKNILKNSENFEEVIVLRKGYCFSRMIDKYSLPHFIDFILDSPIFEDRCDCNLYHFSDYMKNANFSLKTLQSYVYHPYMISYQELSFANLWTAIQRGENRETSHRCKFTIPLILHMLNTRTQRNFKIINFKNERINLSYVYRKQRNVICRRLKSTKCNTNIRIIHTYITNIPTDKKESLKIAIANVRLDNSSFENLLRGNPTRSYARYQSVTETVNAALRHHVDLLIFPESYLPVEWLPLLARTCAKNNMGVITGVEHFRHNDSIFNLTTTILPYQQDVFRFAHVAFHFKVQFSPEEKRQVEGFRLHPVYGNSFELFIWHEIWFPVYCCFEIASIAYRSIFYNLCDFLVIVEWNKDIPYFSNIIESLCRDLHCYCIQVNNSAHGDSRVIQPSPSRKQDLVKIKGGLNHTILITEINIKSLRNFQVTEYELQKDFPNFKPTPPNFFPQIVEKKISGELWKTL